MTDQVVSHSHLSPLRFLQRSAALFQQRTAVIHGEKRYSYAEFAARVNRLASALTGIGVGKGDRVAILAPNIPPLLEAHFAVPLAGAVLVALNTRLAAAEIAYILNDCGATVLLLDAELAGQVDSVRRQLETLRYVVDICDKSGDAGIGDIEYEQFLARGIPTPPNSLPLADEQEMIAINYTSGTTGNPKGVMYNHRGAYLNALAQVVEMRLDSDSVYLWTLPMFHCNGWCCTWATIAAGAANLCLRRIEPGLVWQLIQSESVSHLCAAPTVLISLANHPAITTVRLTRQLRIGTGGAPPSPTLLEQMAAAGADITHLYGLTETYGPNTICEWQSQWNGLNTSDRAGIKARQGVAHVNADPIRVVDEHMVDVPADGQTMGEVVMRGNTVMMGYYRQPEATAEAFRGGWFHSGDLGVMHPDGYVELRDRKKDIIISGGENISTIEVERTIARHPAVLEAAVIAVPDERWGEVPKAFVTLKEGMQLSDEDLFAFCRQRMAHFKCPKSIAFGDLPKTSTGKIQKFVLREREWAGRDKRIQ